MLFKATCRFIVFNVCLVGVLILHSQVNAAGINMNDGRWEITTKMEMTDLPFEIPPMSYTTCLTKEGLIPMQEGAGQNGCQVTQKSIVGDTVTWTLECDTENGKSISSGTMTYQGDSFKGKMSIQSPEAGTMHQTMTGRRLGPCDN